MSLPFLRELSRPFPAGLGALPADDEGEAPGGSGPERGSLTFVLQRQEQSNWCWAAVATSVALHYDTACGWEQCRVADAELGLDRCCQDGGCTDCNVPWTLSAALRRTNTYDRMEPQAARFEDVRDAIVASRPMCARIEWQGGGGHYVVLAGFQEKGGKHYVLIEDSDFGQYTYEFGEFLTAYEGSGTCTNTYWTRKP